MEDLDNVKTILGVALPYIMNLNLGEFVFSLTRDF